MGMQTHLQFICLLVMCASFGPEDSNKSLLIADR
jgi:hypothetical protein